ncbi:MAG: flagellar biosynthetic protein FliR [Rhizobiaceae bacterium]|nr:flagellar biosynthetic protein FliR [Rhizobiaceae bacterium]
MINGEIAVIGLFLVFVRTGTTLMLLPGFSSTQVPNQVRLYSAIGISFAIFPLIASKVEFPQNIEPVQMLSLIAAEIVIGAIMAIPVRFFIMAISFIGEIITQVIGLNTIPGISIGETQSTTLSTMFEISTITLFFISGLHVNFIMALLVSYTVYPVGDVLDVGVMVESLATHLSQAFQIVIRLAAPILICSIVMNLIAGLVNKLTPQIPIYFVSTPFLITVGLALLIIVGDDMLVFFNLELARLIDGVFG